MFNPKIVYPSQTWIDQAAEETRYTPDLIRLEQHEAHLLFVCCELQRNLPRYSMVNEGGVYLCSAFTEINFSTYKRKLGKASIQIPLMPDYNIRSYDWADPTPGTPVPIKGELWAVLPSQIIDVLDKYKLNTVQFIRVRVNIRVPYRHIKWLKDPATYARDHNLPQISSHVLSEEKVRYVRAWMYVGIPEYWEPQLDGGHSFGAVRIFRSKNPFINSYSYFTPMELQGD